MVTHYIDVPHQKWGIVIICDFDTKTDYTDISAILKSFGMRRNRIGYAISVLSTPNSGLTVSNDDLRMSAVFIGNTTSYGQFWNTIAHELKHVSDAIIDYYGEAWDGEPAAYLTGYLFQEIVEEIAEPCF